MSAEEAVNRARKRSASGPARLGRAWRTLPSDQRLAAAAALGLFLTLFLPWYQETGLASAGSKVQTATASLTGWAAFSWVEAAVLLVAVGVLALLFLRAEGRAFHLPGGDGLVVTAAGGWTCVLVIWRIFDKQGVTSRGQFATTSGIEWGIIITLGVAALLAYAGSRIRAARLPEPPLPGDDPSGEDAGPWPERVRSPELGRRARRPGAAAPAPPGAAPAAADAPAAPAPPGAAAAAPAAPAAPAPPGAEPRTEKRASQARRAPWAEPVTWDEPAAIAEPPVLAAPRVATPPVPAPADAHRLEIPFEDGR